MVKKDLCNDSQASRNSQDQQLWAHAPYFILPRPSTMATIAQDARCKEPRGLRSSASQYAPNMRSAGNILENPSLRRNRSSRPMGSNSTLAQARCLALLDVGNNVNRLMARLPLSRILRRQSIPTKQWESHPRVPSMKATSDIE